jgi:hypothetical protein
MSRDRGLADASDTGARTGSYRPNSRNRTSMRGRRTSPVPTRPAMPHFRCACEEQASELTFGQLPPRTISESAGRTGIDYCNR